MPGRRKFLKVTVVSGFGTLLNHDVDLVTISDQIKKGYQVGLAGYTFRYFNVDQTIAMMKRVAVNFLSIKDFHLPLDSNKEKMNEVLEKFRANGITIYAAGVIYMNTEKEIDTAFEYAKNAGIPMIVGVPLPELLPYTEQKIKSYDIRVAIHNHGPEDKVYPGPAEAYSKIRHMDKRLGLCLDIGHSARAGQDPVKAVLNFAPRIFDLHIKDLAEIEKEGKPAEVGRGAIDIPGLVMALNKIKFDGKCSIEFEMDMKDPLPGIAESVGFFRGVVKALG